MLWVLTSANEHPQHMFLRTRENYPQHQIPTISVPIATHKADNILEMFSLHDSGYVSKAFIKLENFS